jgi:hypothetical protein
LPRLAAFALAGLPFAAAPPVARAGGPPTQVLFADDGAAFEAEAPLRFAVLGNTRGLAVPGDATAGAVLHKGATRAILADLQARIASSDGPELLLLTGGQVRSGAAAEYKSAAKALAPVLAGTTPVKTEGLKRLAGVPVAGDHEAAGDDRYAGFGEAWPGVGADIGFGRVATWYWFDVRHEGFTWRFVVMDAGKAHLGSRWTEQLGWIERSASQGKFDGAVVLMHEGLVDLGGREPAMNRDDGPRELLEALEDKIGLARVKAVIFDGHGSCQSLLPDGPLGTLHVGGGCAGGPVRPLRRWSAADQAGIAKDVPLEPLFDLALMAELDRRARDEQVPEIALDEARSRNSFEGFPGTYNARHAPALGWWEGAVQGGQLSLGFRVWRPDGSLHEVYRVTYLGEQGWKPARTAAPR